MIKVRAPRLSLFLLLLTGLWLSHLSHADTVIDRPDFAGAFNAAGVKGTFVLYDVAANQTLIYPRQRALQRFIPASTFKIPNSLIALETGAVRDLDEIQPYGGKPQRLAIWEKDMNLRDAIRVSNVPVYQVVARRIGQDRMAEWVKQFNYGNRDIGKVIDRFWLDGPLTISAIEQTRFLAKLAQKQLPLSKTTMDRVHDLTLQDQTEDYRLYAKTGWSDATRPGIGWWVGWVERDSKIYAFALNIDINTDRDADQRMVVARKLLADSGVI
ncbi:class D beta-lactamase [Chitinivorax sp. B]|uniref:class D beta-lactamase n=1 Tax=Chitinivorax sp. B TaxID=2502235 RepID=UPI0014857F9A|nr:class D beta-lactamase [Chitinivorax sp. B]